MDVPTEPACPGPALLSLPDGEPIAAPRVSSSALVAFGAAPEVPEPFAVGVLVPLAPAVGVVVMVMPTGLPFPVSLAPGLPGDEPAAIVVTGAGARPDDERFPPSDCPQLPPSDLASPVVVGAAKGTAVGWIAGPSARPVGPAPPVVPPVDRLPADAGTAVGAEIVVAVAVACIGDTVTAAAPRVFA